MSLAQMMGCYGALGRWLAMVILGPLLSSLSLLHSPLFSLEKYEKMGGKAQPGLYQCIVIVSVQWTGEGFYYLVPVIYLDWSSECNSHV